MNYDKYLGKVVEFKQPIDIWEDYAEPGMRARIVSIKPEEIFPGLDWECNVLNQSRGPKMIEAKHGEIMTVWDGNSTVARAKKILAGGWLLTMFGACWIENQATNIQGSTDPYRKLVKDKRVARKEMKLLLKQISKGREIEI